MTVTPSSTPSFGGHMFLDGKFSTPVYFEGDDGAGAGGAASAPDAGAAPAADASVVDASASIPDPADAGGGDADAAAQAEADAAAAAAAASPDDEAIPEALRPYVKQLRDEAAERRVSLKPYEDAFGSFDEGDREALLGVVAALGSEETQTDAARTLKELAESILGNADDPDRPLTRADLDRIESEKQAKAQEEASVQAVIKEAVDLGYPEGTREHRRLFDVALNETNGDLAKAHEALTAERDTIIAEYAKQVQEGKAKWPTLAPLVGSTPADVSGKPPSTFAEARANTIARAKAAASAL